MSTSEFIFGFIKLFFEKTWELLSIPWPGFSFSIAEAFIGVLVACAALAGLLRMVGVSLPTADSMAHPYLHAKKEAVREAKLEAKREQRRKERQERSKKR